MTNIVPLDLLEEIKKEKQKWNQNFGGKYSRQYDGTDKGKIIANLIINHNDYKEIFTDKNGFRVSALLKKMGIKLKFGDLNPNDENKNAWGLFDKKTKTVWVSSHLETDKAIRFTIAHELGHIFIDYDKDIDVYFRNKLKSYNEVIIDDFAANLLVPISKEELKKKFKNKSVYDLANEFLVPLKTIEILLKKISTDEEALNGKKENNW